jgi:hypothetical protein
LLLSGGMAWRSQVRALEALMGQAAKEEWVTTTEKLEEALQTVQRLKTSEREAKALAASMAEKVRGYSSGVREDDLPSSNVHTFHE